MKKTSSSLRTRRPSHWRLRPLALSLACIGMAPAGAQTVPTNATLGAGAATVGAPIALPNGGLALGINQTSQRAVLNWQTFSIGALDRVNIAQDKGPTSVLLNRVTGAQASQIQGQLNANGQVYLVNPNGVTFSSTSQVSVGGLVASTLNMVDDAQFSGFMSGTSKQFAFELPVGKAGTVLNQGTITAADGGIVALIGAQARNEGSINVARGSIGLAAGQRVTLDFDGDGLTSFHVDPTVLAASARAENAASGVLSASGGRVVMVGASSAAETVVNQAGIVRAQSISNRGGEIILGSSGGAVGNAIVISGGQLDVSGVEAGVAGGRIDVRAPLLRIAAGTLSAGGATAGGGITTQAAIVEVGRGVVIDAHGGSGANGNWTLDSGRTLVVTQADPIPDASVAIQPFGTSKLADSTLGATMGRATDVVLASHALPQQVANFGGGVQFDNGSQVIKTEGRASQLTVNSDRSVVMDANSALRSTAGALNIDFNADASGVLLPVTPAVTDRNDNNQRVGNISISGTRIETAGGNLRLYGQSDAVNGRALGATSSSGGGVVNGVTISDSAISTCAQAGGVCGGSGSILVRGQGATAGGTGQTVVAGPGVRVDGGSFETGSGTISMDGRGGLAQTGVTITGLFGEAFMTPSSLRSASGDITLVGSTRSWTAGETSGTLQNVNGGSGIELAQAGIATGGNVRLDGSGADLTGLMNQAAFQTAAAAANNGAGTTFGASNGVTMADSSIVVGAGKSLDLLGTAGSRGFSVTGNKAPVLTLDANDAFGVVVRANASNGLQAEGGRITINGRGSDVALAQFGGDAGPTFGIQPPGESILGAQPRTLLSTRSEAMTGGNIAISGRNVVIAGSGTAAVIDSGGAGQSGNIAVTGTAVAGVNASGIVVVGDTVELNASATSAVGNAGRIDMVGDESLYANGRLSARGGSAGGNGGRIETSAPALQLQGIRVDASASAGQAGSWVIDPVDVTIAHGAAAGTLPTNPFVPLVASTVQDGDINFALDNNTGVTITTGTPAPTTVGNVTFGLNTVIQRTSAGAPVKFEIDANAGIAAFNPTVIQSTGGALDVVLSAGLGGVGGNVNYSGQITTNGGSVSMTGTSLFATCGVCLTNAKVDTRVGQSDANAGGAVQLIGTRNPGAYFFLAPAVVGLTGSTIQSATGDVTLSGISNATGTGVQLISNFNGTDSSISTTSGAIRITGVGNSLSGSGAPTAGHGVEINGATVQSVSGNISVHGLRVVQTPDSPVGNGVRIVNGGSVTTLGAGNIEITGESQIADAGIFIQGPTGTGIPIPASRVAGDGNVVLRAASGGTADALAVGGSVNAGGVLDLRPGGVDAAGNAGDRIANPITLGGTAANGFAVSADELTRITAGSIVVGSNTQAGNIDVVGPLAMVSPLTLQNGGGGNITLGASVSAPQLGLLSAGNITQAAGADIAAGTLLARSTGGNVLLSSAANDVGVVSGGAAGRFEYTDVNAVTVGNASVIGFDAASNTPQAITAGSMAADTVFLRTLGGDLSLNTSVTSGSGADLVAAARFQNLAANTIAGAPWRVWAQTWIGETRNGLSGSGPLPNLYHCAYLGLCSVGVTPGDNHFIYAQQPTATVVIGNATRPGGLPNPPFIYSLTGLILGDTGSSFAGALSSPANASSPPGAYPINGAFASAAGYAVNVVPGQLNVGAVPAPSTAPVFVLAQLSRLPKPDVLREMPDSWIYDRNIGAPPICFATGPLDGERAQQGGDVLASEWSRVRSRPNLTSCVDTERRNGCSDF
ncbi:filamentous hemagglutinin family protein [Variovorax sp. GrIS 2.14]|uniref:beta strand repeat-containing protein n=1 Tax=Variovorax sp. GrIS 2.14 TaxID=3071709 RepID=UPI0038F73E0E